MKQLWQYCRKTRSYFFLLRVFRVFFARGIGIVSLFLLNLLISRYYSAQDAGIFFWLQNIIMVLGSVATFGNHEYMIKVVGANVKRQRWNDINASFSRGIYIAIITNLLFFLLFFLWDDEISFVLLKKPSLTSYMGWIAIGSLFYSVILMSSTAIQGKNQAAVASFVQNTLTPVLFLSTMALICINNKEISINTCFFIYLFALFGACFFGLLYWFKEKNIRFIFEPGFGDKQFRKTIRDLWLITLMGLLVQWGSMSISIFFLTTNEIAHYAIAYRVGTIMTFLLVAVNFVVAPHFSQAASTGDIDEIKNTALISCTWLTLCSLPLFAVLFVFAAPILRLFGQEYSASAYLLRIILIGQLVNVMSGSIGYIFTMTGHEKTFRNILICSGIVSLILTFILITQYSIVGCAIAFSASIGFHNILSAYFVRKKLGFWIYNIFKKSNK